MWIELLVNNAQEAWHILWPLMDNVVIGVCLDQPAWGGSSGGAHVCEEEATIRLGTDLIRDGCKSRNVRLCVGRVIDVGDIEVVPCVLEFEQRQQTSSPEDFSVVGGS